MAAAISLSGCGGSNQAGTSAPPANTSSSGPALTPAAKAYTNDELTSIVAGLKDAQGSP